MNVERVWSELVTAALLGTTRREPPELPPGLLADVAADRVAADPGAAMIDTVAAVAAARRAAFSPLPAAAPLQGPEPDRRLVVPADAVAAWRSAVGDWPILEDEWLIRVIDLGWRLPPDAVVDLLARTRGDRIRRERVRVAAGPLADWVGTQVKDLATRDIERQVDPEELMTVPDLPLPPDLDELRERDALTFSRRISERFQIGEFGPAHRQVLTNLFARCRPGVLIDAADTLSHHSDGLAHSMARLCRARHGLLLALE